MQKLFLYIIIQNIHSGHKPNLESTSKSGFSSNWGKNGGVLSMRMQVILDSIFARSGSAPIWGGKKGEFRDWTSHLSGFDAYKGYASLYCSFQKHKHNISISNREHPWHKHKHKQKNEPTYLSYAVLTCIFQSLKFPVIITIPNLVPLFLQSPESRPWNKPNPGSRKTYWGPSINADTCNRPE